MFNTQSVLLKNSLLETVLSAVFRIIPKLPTLIFELPFCSFSRKISCGERQAIINVLEKGDILLTSDRVFPLLQFAEAVMGSPRYSHAAIYEGDNSVIEATTFHPSGNGVARTEINDFLSGRKNIGVVRPSYPSHYDKETMFVWLQQQLGKPYDYDFSTQNNGAMYCSKLVAKAMRVAGFPIEETRFLWFDQYLPDAFIRQPGMNTVYCKRTAIVEKIPCFLLAVCLSVILLTNYSLGTVLCAAALGLMLIAGWLQHLKIL